MPVGCPWCHRTDSTPRDVIMFCSVCEHTLRQCICEYCSAGLCNGAYTLKATRPCRTFSCRNCQESRLPSAVLRARSFWVRKRNRFVGSLIVCDVADDPEQQATCRFGYDRPQTALRPGTVILGKNTYSFPIRTTKETVYDGPWTEHMPEGLDLDGMFTYFVKKMQARFQ